MQELCTNFELLCNSIIAFIKSNRNFTDNERTHFHAKVYLPHMRTDLNVSNFPTKQSYHE